MRTPFFRRRIFSIASAAVLAVLAVGCESVIRPVPQYFGQPSATGAMQTPDGATVSMPAQDMPAAQDCGGETDVVQQGPARQMVYSARFDLATSNVEEAMSQFVRTVQGTGGYLESREDSRVVCRVPAARFQEIVAAMPSLGSVLSQTIRNDDVTRKHQDLRLHLETAEWSRQRVLGLLQKADKIEDIIKLEEELLKLTAAIETLKGTLEDLSEQIAYSRVEVLFRPRATESRLGRPEAYSPFAWINRIGAEQVLGDFGSVENDSAAGVGGVATLFSGGLSAGRLDGFLVVKNDRSELKAITPDASKLWVREFSVPQTATLEFWSKAIRSDLAGHRGYVVVEEKPVRDDKGNEGTQMICDVVAQGQSHRYMLDVYVINGLLWRRGGIVRTVEFVAPTATFEKYAAVVRDAYGVADVADRKQQLLK